MCTCMAILYCPILEKKTVKRVFLEIGLVMGNLKTKCMDFSIRSTVLRRGFRKVRSRSGSRQSQFFRRRVLLGADSCKNIEMGMAISSSLRHLKWLRHV